MVAVKIVSDWRRWLQPPSSGAAKLRRHLSAKMDRSKKNAAQVENIEHKDAL